MEWDAVDLAAKVGIRRETILSIENSLSHPRSATMDKIVRVFDENGIEFVEDRGVALVGNYRLLKGSDCYLRLIADVHETLRDKPIAEALFICVNDAVSTPEIVAANKRIRDDGIRCRYLCSTKTTRFDFDKRDYRAIPEQFYTNGVMVVFGNKVATAYSSNDAVLVITDKEQANMLRGLFEMIWLQSQKIK